MDLFRIFNVYSPNRNKILLLITGQFVVFIKFNESFSVNGIIMLTI